MTHLGQFLKALMERHGEDAKTMSERLGISPAVLSRLVTGQRRTCGRRTLRRIVTRCSTGRLDQINCLSAWLEDQLFAPFELQAIEITSRVK